MSQALVEPSSGDPLTGMHTHLLLYTPSPLRFFLASPPPPRSGVEVESGTLQGVKLSRFGGIHIMPHAPWVRGWIYAHVYGGTYTGTGVIIRFLLSQMILHILESR